MGLMTAPVESFLRGQGLLDNPELTTEKVAAEFGKAMEHGLGGDEDGLPMLPSFIDPDQDCTRGRPVAVIDAGGTHLRCARVTLHENGKPIIDQLTRVPMPGTEGTVLTREEFFAALVAVAGPLLEEGVPLGFCFSYPAEATPDGDVKLLKFVKEVQAPEVVGTYIGEGFRHALRKWGWSHPSRIRILNDTTAALLAGKTAAESVHYDDYIGFILGTGLNAAYCEHNEAIRKITQIGGRQIINIEAASFDRFNRTDIDRDFDEQTALPGQHLLEKAVSGRYFGPLCLAYWRAAAQCGVFSNECRERLAEREDCFTEEAGKLLSFTDTEITQTVFQNAPDQQAARTVAAALRDRAVNLSAAVLTACCRRRGRGQHAPVCINVDGSTYYKLPGYREMIEAEVLRLAAGNYRVEFVQIDNAPLIGAAVAAGR